MARGLTACTLVLAGLQSCPLVGAGPTAQAEDCRCTVLCTAWYRTDRVLSCALAGTGLTE